jgi:hypothetical protein
LANERQHDRADALFSRSQGCSIEFYFSFVQPKHVVCSNSFVGKRIGSSWFYVSERFYNTFGSKFSIAIAA